MNTDNLLAGAIAVELGLLSQEKLDACIREQESTLDPRPIGTLLLEKGLIDRKQLDELLRQQRRRMDEFSEARLFGQIALSRNYITAGQLGECIREQLRVDALEDRPLIGELMLKKKYITLEQFQEVIITQGKALFHCAPCDLYYAYPSNIALADAVCRVCNDLLRVVEDVGELETSKKRKGDTTIFFKVPLANMGKFEILGEVARGPMGIVFKAYDQTLDRKVALKVLKEKDVDAEFIQRLHREALTAAKLQHPHIVRIHEVGKTKGLHYICMDYLPGWHLTDYVRAHRVPLPKALRLFEKAARAVHYAHTEGVIHRDLKPSNIVVKRDGTPYVTDFGLTKKPDVAASRKGPPPGMPYYQSPEQVSGQSDKIDQRSDVYSLGAVLYEMLTGVPPHGGANAGEVRRNILNADPARPSTHREDLDADLEAVCLKALEKESEFRYDTAEDLAFDIGRYLKGEPVMASQTSLARLWAKRLRRHGMKIAAVAAVVVVAVAFLVGYSALRTESDVSDLLREADELFDRKAWESAREKYGLVIDLDPGNVRANRRMGECDAHIAEIRKRREEAAAGRRDRDKTRRRRDAQPHFDTGFQRMNEANILVHQPGAEPAGIDTRFEDAVDHFTKAIERDPEFADAYLMRGRCSYELGRFRAAERDLSESFRHSEGRSASYFLRGKVYLALAMLSGGTRQTALRAPNGRPVFRPSSRESPQSAEYRLRADRDFRNAAATSGSAGERTLMSAFRALAAGEPREAIDGFKKIVSTDSMNPDAFYGCGYAHLTVGEYETALEMLDQAVRLRPNLYPARTLQALARYGNGDVKGAIEGFRFSVEHRPDPVSCGNLAAILAVEGRLEEALEIIASAARRAPDRLEYRVLRARLLFSVGRFDESVREAERILEKDADNFDALLVAGFGRAELNGVEQAVRYLDRALSIRPNDAEVLSNYAVLLLDRDEEQAWSMIRRALASDPNDGHAYNIRGVLHSNAGKEGLAEKDFRRSIELDPGNGKAYLNLAAVLKRRRAYEEALEIVESGGRLDPRVREEAQTEAEKIRRLMAGKE